jgi:hypothetical protein
MTTQEQEKMINDYLGAVLQAISNRAVAYCNAQGLTINEKLIRVTEVKNDYKAVSEPNKFSIRAFDYSRCPSGVCVGGVCVEGVAFRDDGLDGLVDELAIAPESLQA